MYKLSILISNGLENIDNKWYLKERDPIKPNLRENGIKLALNI